MPLETHLSRRGSVYQFRVRLPQDIAGRTNGTRELRFSLKTRDPVRARRLAGLGRIAMTRLIDKLREPSMPDDALPVRYLSTKEIRDLARTFFLQELDRDEIIRVNAGEFGPELERRRQQRPAEELALREAIGAGTLEPAREDADRVLAYSGIDPTFAGQRVTIPANMLNQLCYFLLRAKLAANRVAQAHDQGDFGVAPPDPLFADILTTDVNLADPALLKAIIEAEAVGKGHAALTERQSLPLSQLCPLLFKEKTTLKAKTRGDYENAIAWLIQVIGDRPVGRVREDDLLKFKDVLLDAPANFRKLLKTDNILEAVKLNAKRAQPFALMSHITVNTKYLGALREVFAWAQANNMTPGKTNPAISLRVKATRERGKKRRLPFSPSLLKQLFDTPIYRGCKSPDRLFESGNAHVHDHRFWAPLLALFSGARLNELGQMEVADIKAHNDMPHLFVRTARDPEEYGDDLDADLSGADRSLKTASAERKIPIHEELLRIGFLNYVAELRDSAKPGQPQRLFPRWNKAADGYYSSVFSKWFNGRFLVKHGLKTPKHVFHSLRHNFKDALRNGGVTAETQDRFMGHSSGHVGEVYGAGDLVEAQSKEIGKLQYGGLDLSHLYIANPIHSI